LVVSLQKSGILEPAEFAAQLASVLQRNSPSTPFYESWFEAALEMVMMRRLIIPTDLIIKAEEVGAYRLKDHGHNPRPKPIAVTRPGMLQSDIDSTEHDHHHGHDYP
jgi:hypothetical protein